MISDDVLLEAVIDINHLRVQWKKFEVFLKTRA